MNTEIEVESILKLQSCAFEYHFKTKYGCPETFVRNESFGSKQILIWFVVLFSLYCVGFSVMNYRSNPEDGLMKAFPHRDFWLEFFDNAAHGVKVVVRVAKSKLKGQEEY